MVYLYVLLYLHHVEVCTHLYKVQAGSCHKCELCNWGDVSRDNLWPGNEGFWESGGVYYGGLSCENCCRVNRLLPGGATLPSWRK